MINASNPPVLVAADRWAAVVAVGLAAVVVSWLVAVGLEPALGSEPAAGSAEVAYWSQPAELCCQLWELLWELLWGWVLARLSE